MNKFTTNFPEMDKFSSLIHRLACHPPSSSSGPGGYPEICSLLAMAPPYRHPAPGCNFTDENCTTTEPWSRLWPAERPNHQEVHLIDTTGSTIGNNPGITVGEYSISISNDFILSLTNFLQENIEFTYLTIFLLCYLLFGLAFWVFSRVFPCSPLKIICEYVLSHLTFLIIIPFFLILLLGNALLRLVTSLSLKIVHKRRYSVLSGSDAFWAHNDVFANTTNFYALYVLEGNCDIEKIRDKIQKKVIEKRSPYNGKLMYSRLKHKIMKKFSYFCCERIPESEFHINNHIKYIDWETGKLDRNMNERSSESAKSVEASQISMTESQVFEKIGQMCNVPLDDSKPQWEILIIPKYTYNMDLEKTSENSDSGPVKNYYALIYRIHHSFMDGISAGYALQTAMADTPPKLAIDPMKKINIPLYQRIFMYILLIVMGPVVLLRAILQTDSNSFHGPDLAGPKNIAWSKPVDLEALKEIKNRTKTTTTAILLSCLGSSIRSLAIKKKVPVPEKINSFITIAMLPYPNSHPQNRFALTVLPIRIGLETCLERLKAAYKSLCDLNCSPDIILSFYFIKIVGLFPAVLINHLAELVHTTLLLSNVPGPAETTYMFDGDRLADATCWSPIKGKIGIGMSLFSYAGRVRASMVSDHAVLPDSSDIKHLIKAFENEVENLGVASGVSKNINIFHTCN